MSSILDSGSEALVQQEQAITGITRRKITQSSTDIAYHLNSGYLTMTRVYLAKMLWL